jgi:hypothetical protein
MIGRSSIPAIREIVVQAAASDVRSVEVIQFLANVMSECPLSEIEQVSVVAWFKAQYGS